MDLTTQRLLDNTHNVRVVDHKERDRQQSTHKYNIKTSSGSGSGRNILLAHILIQTLHAKIFYFSIT